MIKEQVPSFNLGIEKCIFINFNDFGFLIYYFLCAFTIVVERNKIIIIIYPRAISPSKIRIPKKSCKKVPQSSGP